MTDPRPSNDTRIGCILAVLAVVAVIVLVAALSTKSNDEPKTRRPLPSAAKVVQSRL